MKIIESICAFFVLVRWFHELVAILPFLALYLIIEYYIQQRGDIESLQPYSFIIVCIAVQLLIAAGCIFNDIMDLGIDKINKRDRHIIGRKISLKNAWRLFAATSVLILAFSVYISIYLFSEWAFIAAGVYLLSLLYSIVLKKSPLMGNIAIAFLAAFIPLVILFFAKDPIALLDDEKINTLIYLYALFPFFITTARELSLDISDMEGDKAGGCKTLPVVIGAQKAKWVVMAMIGTVIAGSFFLMAAHLHLYAAICVVDAGLLYYLRLFRKAHTRLDIIRAGRWLWFVMIAGLAGFALATLYS